MFSEMLPLLRNSFHAEVTLLPIAALPASSTEIRRMAAQGRAESMLPEQVLGYIRREGLYGYAGGSEAPHARAVAPHCDVLLKI